MWEPDRGRLGRRFGSRRRGRARGRAGARWSRSASRWRRQRSEGSSADRPSPPIAACGRRSSSSPSRSAASPRPGWGRLRPAAIREIDRAATSALRRLGPGPPARTLAFPELNLGGRLVELGAVDDPAPLAAAGVGPAAAHVRPGAVRGRPGGRAGRCSRVAEPGPAPGRRRARVGPAAGHAWPRSRARPTRRRAARRRCWWRAASRSSPRCPSSRRSTAHTGGRRRSSPHVAARLADRRPARPPGGRREQRPPPGHLVRPDRADNTLVALQRADADLGPADAARRRAARRPSCSDSCCSRPRACAATPAPSGRGSSATAPGSASCGRSHGSRRPGSPSPGRSWARCWQRPGWRSPPTGPASARRRCCATRSSRGPGVTVIAACLGGRGGRARRGRAHGRRRPAPRAGARPRPGGPGRRGRGRARGRPRQRELDVARLGLRPAAGPSARPRRGRRGDRDRAPCRAAAAPGGPGPPAGPAERAARARSRWARGRPAHPGRRVPGRGARPRRVRGAYRATLVQGEHDQAAFQVPLDFTLSEGPALRLPLEVAPVSRYRRLAPARWRRRCSAPAGPHPRRGCPRRPPCSASRPSAITAIRNWRADFASVPQRGARRGAAAGSRPPTLQGADLPPAADGVELEVTTHGRPVSLVLAVRERSGGFDHIALGDTARGQTTTRRRACRRATAAAGSWGSSSRCASPTPRRSPTRASRAALRSSPAAGSASAR